MERGEERHQLLLAERHAHAGLLRARHGDAAALDSHDVLPGFQAVDPIPPEVIGRGWLVADALRHIAARHHPRGDHVHAGKWFARFVHDAPLDGDAGRQRKSEVSDVFAGADRERAPGIVRPARANSGRKVTALVERGRHNQAIGTGRDAREAEASGGIRRRRAPVDSCPFEVSPRRMALHDGSCHEHDHGSLDRGPGPGRLDTAGEIDTAPAATGRVAPAGRAVCPCDSREQSRAKKIVRKSLIPASARAATPACAARRLR